MDWESIQRIDRSIEKIIEDICSRRGLEYKLEPVSKGKQVILDKELLLDLENIAEDINIEDIILGSKIIYEYLKKLLTVTSK